VVTKPLALLFYEKLLPGSQLLNRLQDLGYRVQSTGDVNALPELAKSTRPLVVFIDLRDRQGRAPTVVESLKLNEETRHLPIVAFAGEKDTALQNSARKAGATMVINDAVLVPHLEQFLEQALQVE
jgi:CheY-like chemotaxis protein